MSDFPEVEIHRKLKEQATSSSSLEKNETPLDSPSSKVSNSPATQPSAVSSSISKQYQDKTDRVSPSANQIGTDEVSSSLSSKVLTVADIPSKSDAEQQSPLDVLGQIFPGRPKPILETVLRESKGDIVRALEMCAKSAGSQPTSKKAKLSHSVSRSPKPVMHPRLEHSLKHRSDINANGYLHPSNHQTAVPVSTDAPYKLPDMPTLYPSHKSAFIPTHPTLSAAAALYRTSLFHHHQPDTFLGYSSGTVTPKEPLFPFAPPLFPPFYFPSNQGASGIGLNFESNPFLEDRTPSTPPGGSREEKAGRYQCADSQPKVDSTADDKIDMALATAELRD